MNRLLSGLRFFFVALCLGVFALGFSSVAQSPTTDDLLQSMTLEQKVAQMFMTSFYGPQVNKPTREFLQTWQPGFVVLFPSNLGNPPAITRLTNDLQQTVMNAGGLPLFIAVDQEGGKIAHLKEGFTEWPAPMLLTATGDTVLAYHVGQSMASEMRAVGINMNLAPVADLETNRANPIISRRSFGSKPEMVGPIVSAFLTGMQDNGVMATAKHFPGHGDTDTDSHLAMPVVDLSYQRLQSVELAPFRATVAAGVGAVMVAHIWYPALDLEALPASLSYNIVTGLLRNDIGYEGLIMTDALDMDAIDLSYTPERSALLAVKAGHDVIAIGAHVGLPSQAAAIQTVIDAVRRGDISEERIDASVRRILDAKMRFGLFDWQPLDPETTSRRIKLDEHAALVETMFRAGVTVVYDKSMTIPENVTLIYPATRPSILRECRALKASLQAIGVSEYPSDEQIALAQRAAAMSEKVVVFTTGVEGQFRLVQALPPEKTLVVSLMSPYDVLNFPDVAGYITTYSPLSPAISAVCGILFGNIQPRGRLPVSLP